VSSGTEAFDALATQQYDVIISALKMPDHDGIEVLEFARDHQHYAVRVLLTGYLDERAQRALMSPDAPYKVGKPWHDEIEVVVRRGLEQRDAARRLTASVQDALSMSTFDEELAKTDTPLELSEAVVRRALAVEAVTAAATVVRTDETEHPFTGGGVSREGTGWFLDLPLDAEGELRLRARGFSESARQLVSYMAHAAQRACGILEARVSSLHAVLGEGTRMNQLMRQATLGALTSTLLHDLAATMQALNAELSEITQHGSTSRDRRSRLDALPATKPSSFVRCASSSATARSAPSRSQPAGSSSALSSSPAATSAIARSSGSASCPGSRSRSASRCSSRCSPTCCATRPTRRRRTAWSTSGWSPASATWCSP
jgi:CheY-like chemotaxis protein